MTTELLNQLKDFEIFVERFDKFIEKIKKEAVTSVYKLEEMDFRTKDGSVYPIPSKLEDYFDIWKEVKDYAMDCYSEKDLLKRESCCLNEYFIDLYWNDIKNNCAYYQDMCFWVYFSNEKGICYDVDETNTPY